MGPHEEGQMGKENKKRRKAGPTMEAIAMLGRERGRDGGEGGAEEGQWGPPGGHKMPSSLQIQSNGNIGGGQWNQDQVDDEPLPIPICALALKACPLS